MKLDISALRYLTSEDWRVLQAVEQGSKNHELVPTPLIQHLSGQRQGVHKCISALAKVGLIAKVKNAKYDGYRLTYGGLDYLALNTHRKPQPSPTNSTPQPVIYSLGNQIGVGKESDIYITASPTNRQLVLKLHRLGRISFRTVKANRDYLRNRSTGSWMYLSRLAAQKEYAVMKVLYREGFPVPEPVGWSRHTVVMEFIDSFPLRMVEGVPEPGKLYGELMELIVRFASRGLIHGDFNEFNILIRETTDEKSGKVTLTPVVIDFPQVVSTNHVNARMYFDRDVECVRRYFERRFKYTSDEAGPFFEEAVKGADPERRLDVEVQASGYSKKVSELDRYVEVVGGDGEAEGEGEGEALEGEDDGEEGDEDAEAEGEVEDDGRPEQVEGLLEGGEEVPHKGEEAEVEARLGSLSVEDDDLAVKPVGMKDYGLVPLEMELPQHPEEVAQKVRTKKKASGWAI
ncbi:Serine/threonine-protein kinase rio2 [Elasticomyces elasticus]|nr:Serine/threonine-protein kinase rio2 [Elasticomyces elasticus]KAK3643387.1 Serine/threonine-protein kinase rio2 [Elasticomyces elasticus]KAK4914015.1 Serine/threonine-protein kinase rio2 [Elasticomyces elasticus]KAK5755474.1 Serine/threonine-protein kinase rio2 [Elasticomyces elasticus]